MKTSIFKIRTGLVCNMRRQFSQTLFSAQELQREENVINEKRNECREHSNIYNLPIIVYYFGYLTDHCTYFYSFFL